MRLKREDICAIKKVVRELDKDAMIYLFGSRTNDNKSGGDIDLLIMSKELTNSDKRRIRVRLYNEIGEQKIDIIIANDIEKPFVKIALEESILL